MQRRYLGIDWADRAHAVWVDDAEGRKVLVRQVAHTATGLAELARWLELQRTQGIEVWAAIERPDGSEIQSRSR